MKKLLKFGFLVALTAVLFTGCGVTTVNNVQNNAFVPVDASSVTLDKIARGITIAGAGLGWQMKKVSDNEIVGTLYLRTHMAQVRIPFTTKDYSITYEKSSNLNYNAENNTIHTNYNGWIQNLDRAIQVQLGIL
jgi:hypothetical protein